MPKVKFKAVQHRAQTMARGLGEDLERRLNSLSLDPNAVAGQIDVTRERLNGLLYGHGQISLREYAALVVALDCRITLVEINDRGR